MVRSIFILLLTALSITLSAYAVDPQDPFDTAFDDLLSDDQVLDEQKSAAELTAEAGVLFAEDRPLDARTKLLKALNKDPKNYDIHLMLGGYYLVHVGHFRLALKYIKQAESLFLEKNGAPPYTDDLLKNNHARLLYLLSETRLNLDNYQGALDDLNTFSSFGYYGQWLPGSRAWVLMKLGRLDEAIKTARLGILAGAEPGRTLNILGILLSMSEKREESLEIFNNAIIYELSQGQSGQPATPLNNSGEVYREIFKEDRAEASWAKALSMPDGCEHILPSLNLSILYLEQLRLKRARETMDNFERCIAQFPLRNGEEHRALENLARGRIALHSGKVDEAITLFESALARRQWFGKIGTNEEDLASGALISLAQSLIAKNHHLDFDEPSSILDWIRIEKEKTFNSVRAWWLLRRARQFLAERLNNFEDLYVRHTDSMLEYHTLGDLIADFPLALFKNRIEAENERDRREGASPYYNGYLAQLYLNHGERKQGLAILEKALAQARDQEDAGLKLQLKILKLKTLDESSNQYKNLAQDVYAQAPAELKNHGLRLPVMIDASNEAVEALTRNAFVRVSAESSYTIHQLKLADEIGFELTSADGKIKLNAQGKELNQAVKDFSAAVFTENLK